MAFDTLDDDLSRILGGGGAPPMPRPQRVPEYAAALPMPRPSSSLDDDLNKILDEGRAPTFGERAADLGRSVLHGVGAVAGIPKAAEDALTRASAKYLYGMNLPDDVTTQHLVRSAAALDPNQYQESNNTFDRILGKGLEEATAFVTDPLTPLLLGSGSAVRGGQLAERALARAGADVAPEIAETLASTARTGARVGQAEKAAQYAFAPLMAAGSIDEARHAYETAKEKGASPELTEALLGTLVSGIMAGGAAHGLTKGHPIDPFAEFNASEGASSRPEAERVPAGLSMADQASEREFLTPNRQAEQAAAAARDQRLEQQPLAQAIRSMTDYPTPEPRLGPKLPPLTGEGADMVGLSPAAAEAAGVRPQEVPKPVQTPEEASRVVAGAPEFQDWAKQQGEQVHPENVQGLIRRWVEEHPDATVDQRAAAKAEGGVPQVPPATPGLEPETLAPPSGEPVGPQGPPQVEPTTIPGVVNTVGEPPPPAPVGSPQTGGVAKPGGPVPDSVQPAVTRLANEPTTATVPAEVQPASVPFMIPRRDMQALADLGYSAEARDVMRPEEAQRVLAAQERAPNRQVVVNVQGKDHVVTLTPEKSDAWEAAKTKYDRSMQYADRIEKTDPEEAQRTRKSAGMKFASEKRQITEKLTPKEEATKSEFDAKIRPGDLVKTPDGDVHEVTGAAAFGRVKIRSGDGSERRVDYDDLTKIQRTTGEESSPRVEAQPTTETFDVPSIERAPERRQAAELVAEDRRTQVRRQVEQEHPALPPEAHEAIATERMARQDAEQAQAAAGRIDPLTGLRTLAAYRERFPEVKAGREIPEGHSVTFVDLKGFKELNDTIGHDAADVVLKHVANILREEAGPENAHRRSGDEFFAVHPKAETRAFRARLKKRLASEVVTMHDENGTEQVIANGIEFHAGTGDTLAKADAAANASRRRTGRESKTRVQPGSQEATAARLENQEHRSAPATELTREQLDALEAQRAGRKTFVGGHSKGETGSGDVAAQPKPGSGARMAPTEAELVSAMRDSVRARGEQPVFATGKPGSAPTVDLPRVRQAFKGVDWQERDGRMEATIRGQRVTVNPDASITVTEAERPAFEASARAHGLEPGAAQPVGKTYTLDGRTMIEFARGAGKADVDEEAFHVAMRIMPDELRKPILKQYGFDVRKEYAGQDRKALEIAAEERAAVAYREGPKEAPTGLFSRVASFFKNIYRSFFPDAQSVFEKIRRGEPFADEAKKVGTPQEPQPEMFASKAREPYIHLAPFVRPEGESSTGAWLKARDEAADVVRAVSPQTPDTPEFRNFFGESKVTDKSGKPLPVYRGDNRADRVGNKFKVNKSTSGRFYFTEDPNVAAGYALSKPDSHAVAELSNFEDWFRFPPDKGARTPNNLRTQWYKLSREQQQRVRDTMLNAGLDDAGKIDFSGDHPMLDQDGWDWRAKEAHGNWLKAAEDAWLNSAAIFNEEERFGEVLKHAGLDNFTFDSPSTEHPGVMPVYLSISRPLDTASIPTEVAAAFERVAKMDRSRPKAYGADQWDKTTITPRAWLEGFHEDQKNGTTHAWTQIPEKITSALQAMGYDGIKDTGGKLGGAEHTVWIAFDPTQIKSAIANRGTYDPTNADVRFATAAKAETPEEPLSVKKPIDLDRIGTEDTVKQAVARIAKTVQDKPQDMAKLAKDAGLSPQQLARVRAAHGDKAAQMIQAGRQLRDAAIEDVRTKFDAMKGAENKLQSELDFSRAVTRAGAITAEATASPEAAAALTAHKMMLEGMRPTEALWGKILRANPALDPKNRAALSKAMESGDRRAISEALDKAMKPGGWAKFMEYWYNGLVSGPPTILGNIAGNTVFGSWLTGESGVTGLIDHVVSKLRGTEQERFAREMFASAGSMPSASVDAFKALGNGLLKEGAQYGSKLEARPHAIEGKLGEVVRAPSRILQASDDAAKIVAFRSKLAALATRAIMRESVKSGDWSDFSNRVEKLSNQVKDHAAARIVRDTGSDLSENERAALDDRQAGMLWATADHFAREATFQDEVGKFTKAVNDLRGAATPYGIPVGNFIVPFTNVVSRILTQAAKRTLLGFVDAARAFKAMREGTGTQGEFSEALTKPLLGVMAGTMIYNAARQGLISGGGPADDRKRKLLEATGWQKYSIKLGDSWYSYQRLDPLSTVFGIAADMAEAKDEKTAGTLAEKLHGALVAKIANASYLRGLTQAIEAASDPKRNAAQYVRDMEGTLVPNVVKKVAQTIDPTLRDTHSALGPIVAGIPLASETLPARMTSAGEEAQRPGSAFERLVSPFPRTTENPDAVLERAELASDYAPSPPSKTLHIPKSNASIELTDRELKLFNDADKATSEKLRAVVESSGWKSLSHDEQKSYLERAYSDGRRATRLRLYSVPSVRTRVHEALAQAKLAATT